MKIRSLGVALVLLNLLSILTTPLSVSASKPKVIFSISDNVSVSDEMYVREGVALAMNYLQESYHAKFHDSIAVNVRDTESPIDPGVLAFAEGDYLVVFTGAPDWDYLAPALRLQVIIHEFVHIYQYDTIGDDEDASPMWLIEGMAEYVSFEVVQSLGVLRADDVYDNETYELARGIDDTPRFEDLEQIADFQSAAGSSPVYPLSFLAINDLAAVEPVRRLTRYLKLVAGGATWPTAFEKAFGSTPDAFYDRFETWVAEDMLSPVRPPDAFAYVSANDAEADLHVLEAPASAAVNDQILIVAQTQPSAECRFELTNSEGETSAEIVSVASGVGLIYWLETISSDFSPGEASISVDCGGAVEQIDLQIDG